MAIVERQKRIKPLICIYIYIYIYEYLDGFLKSFQIRERKRKNIYILHSYFGDVEKADIKNRYDYQILNKLIT